MRFAVFLGLLLLCGCATPVPVLRDYPSVSGEHGKLLVVEGVIRDARGLRPFPMATDCGDEDELQCVNIDPAPFALKIQVTRVLHGKMNQKFIWVATTDHMGHSVYLDPPGQRRVFVLVTDGAGTVLPRYQSHIVFKESNGQSVLPLWDKNELRWLPCEAVKLGRSIPFNSSAAMNIEDFEGWLDATKNNDRRGDFIFKNGKVSPRFGIYLSDLGTLLAKEVRTPSSMGCSKREENDGENESEVTPGNSLQRRG